MNARRAGGGQGQRVRPQPGIGDPGKREPQAARVPRGRRSRLRPHAVGRQRPAGIGEHHLAFGGDRHPHLAGVGQAAEGHDPPGRAVAGKRCRPRSTQVLQVQHQLDALARSLGRLGIGRAVGRPAMVGKSRFQGRQPGQDLPGIRPGLALPRRAVIQQQRVAVLLPPSHAGTKGPGLQRWVEPAGGLGRHHGPALGKVHQHHATAGAGGRLEHQPEHRGDAGRVVQVRERIQSGQRLGQAVGGGPPRASAPIPARRRRPADGSARRWARPGRHRLVRLGPARRPGPGRSPLPHAGRHASQASATAARCIRRANEPRLGGVAAFMPAG
ncbi:MAG: hypothetical protein KatS3mg103_0023 [Phycisphaerales bacterium]|nr:MAG: hypothetical protein KatS3mg103_0023 [Phycisphaerales bacterium]